jgi:Flp pilus assembly protein TadB
VEEALKIKRDNQQITVIALMLYGLIMLSLILIYRDLLITITAVTIMAVLLVQYFVPLVRERKKQKADAAPRSESE